MVQILPSNVLNEGDSVVFNCKVEGYPLITCKWIKDGVNITNNCLDLTIHNINRRDAGEYKCIAENSYGVKVSSRRKLDVYCK